MLKIDVKRAILNWRMLISVIVVFFILIRPLLSSEVYLGDQWGNKLDYLYLLTFPMAFSGFIPFAVMFPMIPYSVIFCDDYNTKYINSIICKSGINKYLLTRIYSVGLSGMLAMVIPFALMCVIIIAFGQPTTKTVFWSGDFYLFTPWENLVYIGGGIFVMFLKLLLFGFFGIIWALIPLTISAIKPNRYIVLLSTFVIYQVLWILMFNPMFNPVLLLRGDIANTNFLQIVLIQLLFILSSIIVFIVVAKRRICR